MAVKQVGIRMSVVGGREVEATLTQIGTSGARAMKQVGDASSVNSFAIQNASYQVQDFFVQVSSGTDISRALGQQLPQLLGPLGLVGVLAGTAAAALIPLFSYMTSTGEAAVDLDDAVDGVVQGLSEYMAFTQLSATSTAELTEKFGAFAQEVQGFAEYMKGVSLGTTLDSLDATIAPLGVELEAVRAAYERVAQAKAFAASVPASDAQLTFQAAEAVGVYQDALDELTGSLGLNESQAIALADAIAAVGDSDGIEAIAASAFDALALLQDMVPAGEALPEPLRAATEALGEMASKAAEADTAAGSAALSFDDVASAAGGASGVVSSLTGDTYALAAAAAAVAANFYAMIGAQAAAQQSVVSADEDAANFRLAGAYGLYADTREAAPDTPPGVRPVRRGGGGGRRGSGGGRSEVDRQQQEDLREAARLFDATRTEAEQYASALADIDRLLAEGDITADVHARSMANLAEEYTAATEEGLTFQDAVQDISDSLIGAARNGENLADALGNAFADIAASLAATQLENLLLAALGPVLGAFDLKLDSPILSLGKPNAGLGGVQAVQKASAAAKAGASAAGAVTVNLHGGGFSKEDTEVRQSAGPNGERQIDIMFKKAMKGAIAGGSLDREMSAAYGVRRVPA